MHIPHESVYSYEKIKTPFKRPNMNVFNYYTICWLIFTLLLQISNIAQLVYH